MDDFAWINRPVVQYPKSKTWEKGRTESRGTFQRADETLPAKRDLVGRLEETLPNAQTAQEEAIWLMAQWWDAVSSLLSGSREIDREATLIFLKQF